ncbi:hypothetical protein BWGOE3_34600 [Bacillus mycoides]|nr:hypothetical protein BWGOE3_34600 [Bacillus mycoides]
MNWFQIIILIWISLYLSLFLIGFLIQKKNLDIEETIIGKILYHLFIIIIYAILMIPLSLLSVIGVFGTFIGLIIIFGSLILALTYNGSNLDTYIILLVFSVCLAYFAQKSYNIIFKVINKLFNTAFITILCNKFKSVLDLIDFRILTYIILLIIYLIKNCLFFIYTDLKKVPKDIFFGIDLPIENLIMVSSEALLTFVIFDTIITNSAKLKKFFLSS